jgi:hypothetical protein
MVECGGDASRLTIHRNKKFCTTLLVHGAEFHFKTNISIANAELMCRCSMRPRVVVPFISMKDTTVTHRKEHQCMTPKCQPLPIR